MLKRIRLTDFKSFVDEQVELAPLTFLVGANASGKSNFLDAIQFLRATEFDMSVAEILNGEDRSAPDAWQGIRGRASETARLGTTSFAIETTLVAEAEEVAPGDVKAPVVEIELSYRLACQTTPQPMLASESLWDANRKVLFSTGNLNGTKLEVPSKTRHRDRTTLVDADRSLIWLILGSGGLDHPDITHEVVTHSLALSGALQRIRFLDVQPGGMRGYGKRSHRLGDDGKNISGVLAALSDNPQEKQSLVGWLAELCAPELTDIDFIEVKELEDVMAVLVEKGGERVTIRSASDGTLRFLGTLLALRTAEPGSVILMEDIETGLHPTRIRLLVEYLQAVARERRLQIIATTHSPTVLEWLDDETLRSVIVFGRVPEQKGTLMRRLGDLPHFPEVVERKGIEELFTTGWLEMAL